MKGIILAGGSGTRLYPLTTSISKQILPVYDKPMIYYPLSTLMLAGIKEVLIISTPRDLDHFKNLLGDGKSLGISIEYETQEKPEGLAQAFIIGEKFIDNQNVCLILGDNIFYGNDFGKKLTEARRIVEEDESAVIFGYYVQDPERYGVVEFENNTVLSIVEKPLNPLSNYAVTGLYFYPNSVIAYAKNVKKSERGEYEITSLNSIFLERKQLSLQILNRGFAWFDCGTIDSLLEATNFIQSMEKRQGLKISCLEEIAYKNEYISEAQLLKIIEGKNSDYFKYLKMSHEGKG